MTYTPKLDDYMAALQRNRVFACEDEHFIGFKYNAPTTYFHDWDNVTLNARGIVFDKATGEIVARPFYKFFNYQELINGVGMQTDIFQAMAKCGFVFDRTLPFRVMDKLDGSLGIIFWDKYAGHFRVKTGGAFGSDQAKWANEWLQKNVQEALFDEKMTYCVEILYDADIHPISYPKEELVLLGAIHNDTGEEVSLEALRNIGLTTGLRVADVIEFDSFDDVIPYATKLPKDKEGVVVTFANGFKVKIKGEEFLALQRQFHALNEDVVWEHFQWNDLTCHYFELDFKMSIPEEMQGLHDYMSSLATRFEASLSMIRQLTSHAFKRGLSRREIWEWINNMLPTPESKKLAGPIMKAVTLLEHDAYCQVTEHESVRKSVYMTLKP